MRHSGNTTLQKCAPNTRRGGGGVMGNLEINGDKQLPSSDETAHNLYTNIEQDNESVLVSLLSVIGMPYSECP